MRRRIFAAVAFGLLAVGGAAAWYLWRDRAPTPSPPAAKRTIEDIRPTVTATLTRDLAARGLVFGSPIYLRIFKESRELEVWVANGARHDLFKTYPICTYSGALGPKLSEGDGQSPEGFYAVAPGQLNPRSTYHLSFNLGFPNAYDRSHGRTGSHLMVHGNCVSIGCYAMTDPLIEEIYVLTEAALRGGQGSVPVHAFPFRMTDANVQRHAGSPWFTFWQDLKIGHDQFEATRQPPRMTHRSGRYALDDAR